MIKKLEVEDIAKIIFLKDEIFDELFPCSVGEWVQFLIQNVDNPNLFIIGSIEDGTLTGYCVSYYVKLPISKSASTLYSKTAGKEINKKALVMMIKWAKEMGADAIDIITNNPVGHSVYGFKKKATVMTLKI